MTVDGLLRSLGDPGRRQVARILAESALTVGEVADVLGLPQSTVSRHLKNLRSTGLLVERREGSRVFIGLLEPSGNGDGDLGSVLNAWLRRQPLSSAVQTRLQRAVQGRQSGDDAFGRLAQQWDELRHEHFGGMFHLEALVSLLPSDWRVLDIGTGTGYLLPYLSRQFREVIAADPSSGMLELARQRADAEGLTNVRFKLGRLEDLPADDASIDCALAVLVLRHSPDLDRSCMELSRALVDGGRLLVVDVVPHEMEDFRRRIGDATHGLEPKRAADALEAAGFTLSERRSLAPPPAGNPAAPSRPAPELFLISAQRKPRASRPKKRSGRSKRTNT